MELNPYQPPLSTAPTLAEDEQITRGPRPIGIWLLSGLHIFVGLAFVALGIGLLIAAAVGVHDATGPMRADWLLTLGISAISAYAIASGVGLWRGSRWGWWLSAFYYVSVTISWAGEGSLTVWKMSQAGDELLPLIVPVALVRLLLHVLLVLYFFKRTVRSFFGLQSLRMFKAIAILSAITIAIGVAVGFVVFLVTIANR